MTICGEYLTYDEYESMGGTLKEMPFNVLEYECRRKIDKETQNRLKNINSDDIPQEVKMCIYKLISMIDNYNSTSQKSKESGNIASENIDGYSVNYLNPLQVSEMLKNLQTEISEVIRDYLIGVIVNDQHIMYAGID